MTDLTVDFDASTRRLEAAYLTADVIEQRRQVVAAMAPAPGEAFLDVGSGPGLLVADLAAAVGEAGRVCGIDQSEAMVALARERCSELPQAELEVADALELPYPDGSFDGGVSTQVYEYVADMPAALAELRRVLRPGGRVGILDTDYDSLVLETDDPDLQRRVLVAWDEHFVHRDLPRKLAPLLRRTGFELREARAIPLLNLSYDESAFSYHLTRLMASFVAGRAGVSDEDAKAWADELARLDSEGRYFYSLNRYLFVADRTD
ncbi:MAG: methyltransferase domain-containing protein [Thermoanaerobaculia bacterium]|nr:methyltransferase domain-containing protein [Thermoanaerobaculia bacterium]